MIELPWVVMVDGLAVKCGLAWLLGSVSGLVSLTLGVAGGIAAALMADKKEK